MLTVSDGSFLPFLLAMQSSSDGFKTSHKNAGAPFLLRPVLFATYRAHFVAPEDDDLQKKTEIHNDHIASDKDSIRSTGSKSRIDLDESDA